MPVWPVLATCRVDLRDAPGCHHDVPGQKKAATHSNYYRGSTDSNHCCSILTTAVPAGVLLGEAKIAAVILTTMVLIAVVSTLDKVDSKLVDLHNVGVVV